ncbi:MAG TPA: response regulator [Tepidisphaeraceae bacterium]|jgi:FixJ family two-component response regulator|nr:response regulator [Tepidisphaeraceae bacterium]
MANATITTKTKAVRPRVLIVDDEPAVSEAIVDVMSAGVACDLTIADSVTAAHAAMADNEPFDLLLTDLNLPDGDGMSLLPALRRNAPAASAIVITGAATVATAVSALREGAVDFMPKPFTGEQLVDRVKLALVRQNAAAKHERKLERLKLAVRRLSKARKTISKKVDLLCNDLIGAYGELSRQMGSVRTEEGFRKAIEGSKDLEQLLCHSMDWLLRQLGYANCAVWLASEEGEFQLGAYMKYTTPGDATLTDAIRDVVLPMATREGFVQLQASELKGRVSPEAFHYIDKQSLVAMNCTYLGESLASIVFFRDASVPFKDEHVDAMKGIGPLFALSLASMVNGGDEGDDGGEGFDVEPDSNEPPTKSNSGEKKAREKKADADWWKRGEAPPF